MYRTNPVTYLILCLFLLAAAGGSYAFSPLNERVTCAFLPPPDEGAYEEGYITPNQYGLDVLHYDITLEVFPRIKNIDGTVVVIGVFTGEPQPQIDLNFYDNMTINELTLNDEPASYQHKGTTLSVDASALIADTFRVKVVYEGEPKRMGLSSFVFGEIDGKPLVYNLNEPAYASTWIPCNDRPADKALMDMRLIADSSLVSVSNGRLMEVIPRGIRNEYHWKTFYPISTYLICLYVHDYEYFEDTFVSSEGDTLPLTYYVLKDHMDAAKKDFADHPKMLELFTDLFGEYPFMKEKYGVAEFLWQMGAMEHQTIIGIGSNFVSGHRFFNDLYVHELAHQWWGNAVGPASWKDIWLNEGFSTYSEALYDEFNYGSAALRASMLSKFSTTFKGTLYDPGISLFSHTVYDKGAWVLHMLRTEVGDDGFFEILQTYYKEFKYSAATTFDFVEVAERVSGLDLTAFFDQWVFTGTGIIELEYQWSVRPTEEHGYEIYILVKQVQDGFQWYDFLLEVALQYGAGEENVKSYQQYRITDEIFSIRFCTDQRPDDIILDPKSRLLAQIKAKKITGE